MGLGKLANDLKMLPTRCLNPFHTVKNNHWRERNKSRQRVPDGEVKIDCTSKYKNKSVRRINIAKMHYKTIVCLL